LAVRGACRLPNPVLSDFVRRRALTDALDGAVYALAMEVSIQVSTGAGAAALRRHVAPNEKRHSEVTMKNNSSLLEGLYEIHYDPIDIRGKPLVFPCDSEGHVPLDDLSETARVEYLYARAVVGIEYDRPAVLPCECH